MDVNTRNMYSCLQKYNKLNTVASCWTVIKFDPRCTDPRSLRCIWAYSLQKCIVRPVYKNIYNAICIDKETTVECYILSDETGIVLNRLNSVVNKCSTCSNVTTLCILPRRVCACLLRVAELVEITCLAQN